MKTNEGRVYFAFDGDDFDPDVVTKLLGIEPSYIKRKGERIPGKIPKRSSWVLSTEDVKSEYVDIYDMSTQIINQLKPKKAQIIELKNKYELSTRLQVVLAIAMSEEISTPAIGFEIDTVTFLGEVGAFIDVDSYRN